jgi:hypothetical protein
MPLRAVQPAEPASGPLEALTQHWAHALYGKIRKPAFDRSHSAGFLAITPST